MEEYNLAKNQRRMKIIKKSKTNQNKRPEKPPRNKEMIDVYQDTIKISHELNLKPKKQSQLINIAELADVDVEKPEGVNVVVKVIVKNIDTLEMAAEMFAEGLRPMVLNLASDHRPGGGVASGKTAQEECIFRRTNAWMTHPSEFYPLAKEECVYSPEVTLIKDINHSLLSGDKCCSFGMLAIAALRQPKTTPDGRDYASDYDRQLMSEKIEAIFKVAIMNGHDSLVLGALGCGVFHNPPEAVASIFRNMIRIYGCHFKRIGFAVLVVNQHDERNFHVFLNSLK
jgi:uncharacterized protein (TIGR02452 family)